MGVRARRAHDDCGPTGRGSPSVVSDDRDDISEQLDGEVLGEQPGDPDRPGVGAYPPDRPLGVEDPSLFDEDDLETRAVLRRRVEGERPGDVALVDPAPVDGTGHDETLVGEGTEPVSTDDLSAEEAAVHVISDTGTDGDEP